MNKKRMAINYFTKRITKIKNELNVCIDKNVPSKMLNKYYDMIDYYDNKKELAKAL